MRGTLAESGGKSIKDKQNGDSIERIIETRMMIDSSHGSACCPVGTDNTGKTWQGQQALGKQ